MIKKTTPGVILYLPLPSFNSTSIDVSLVFLNIFAFLFFFIQDISGLIGYIIIVQGLEL